MAPEAHAESPGHSSELFTSAPWLAAADAPVAADPGVVLRTPLELDPAVLAANPERLSVVLPDGARHTLLRNRWTPSNGDRGVWYGTFQPAEPTSRLTGPGSGPAADAARGFAVLGLVDGGVVGSVRTPDGSHYRLSLAADGSHYLEELDPNAASGCALAGPDASHRIQPPSVVGAQSVLTEAAVIALCKPPSSTHRIDLMVLYHPSFVGPAETTVRNSIVAKVNEANTVFQNSDVSIVYNLIHMGPVTQDPELVQSSPQVVSTARHLGRDSSAEVDELRDDYGADMVAVLLPANPDNPCGAAVLPHIPNSSEVQQSWGGAFIDDAFMAYEYQCGDADFTFAHELGHNFGMQHGRDDPFHSQTPVVGWAYGHLFGGWGGPGATLMACEPLGIRGGQCNRVLYFSHPEKFLEGGQLGEYTTAANGGSFNACVANIRASRYAGFRDLPSDALPTVQITAPAAGASIEIAQDIPLSANASDAEDGALGSAVEWRSDRDGAIGSGSPLSASLHTVGSHVLTASVTDSDGKTVHHSIRVTVVDTTAPQRWTDVPAHDQTLSGSAALVRGWTIDASRVASTTFKIDNNPVNLTSLDTATYRPDVCNAYPDVEDPDCDNVGWQGYLDTTGLSNGTHYLKITATDTQGNKSTVLSRRFKVSNQSIASFAPVADAFVYEALPSTNYGNHNYLYVRGPISGFGMHSYLKFSVSGVTAPVTQATLRLRTGSKAIPGAVCYRLGTTTWGEYSITWNNKPLDSQGSVIMGYMPANTWIERDVTHLVSGNGTYTFACAAWDYDQSGMYFHSRHTNSPPSLVIED